MVKNSFPKYVILGKYGADTRYFCGKELKEELCYAAMSGAKSKICLILWWAWEAYKFLG